jgi:hypothetical protein
MLPSVPSLDDINGSPAATSADFNQLVELVEEQALRYDHLRLWSIFVKYGAATVAIFLLGFYGCLIVDDQWYIHFSERAVVGFFVAWVLISSALTSLIVRLIKIVFGPDIGPFSGRLLREKQVLSDLLQLLREIGPALEQAGLITPLKWATTKILLSRYPI